jgi:hypothetical protein
MVGIGTLLAGVPAAAHGLDANQIQLVLHEQTAEVVATVPSEFAALADTNGDGLITLAELNPRRSEVRAALVASLVVTDGAGAAGTLDRSDISLPRTDNDEDTGRDFIRLTVKYVFPTAPQGVRLRCGFVGQHPVSLYATRAESRSTPGMLTLVGNGEMVQFTDRTTVVAVLGAPSATPSPTPSPTPATTPAAPHARRESPSRDALWFVFGALGAAALALVVALRTRTASSPLPTLTGDSR